MLSVHYGDKRDIMNMKSSCHFIRYTKIKLRRCNSPVISHNFIKFIGISLYSSFLFQFHFVVLIGVSINGWTEC